jgi:hypothetical protein
VLGLANRRLQPLGHLSGNAAANSLTPPHPPSRNPLTHQRSAVCTRQSSDYTPVMFPPLLTKVICARTASAQ